MFSNRSHKENAELTERFSISENVRLIRDLPGVHRLVKLTVNEGFFFVDWIKQSKTKTNHDLLALVFPRFASPACM